MSRAAVDALTFGDHVQEVKHFEQGRAGLVYDANHRASTFGQFLHQGDALQARRTVQTAVKQNNQPNDAINYRHKVASIMLAIAPPAVKYVMVNTKVPGGFVEEHDGRIADQFQSNGQSFSLSAREAGRPCVDRVPHSDHVKDFVDLHK